jgi:hypothetical protein
MSADFWAKPARAGTNGRGGGVAIMSEQASERRGSTRVAVQLSCQCVGEDFALIGEQILDVSADGLLVRTDGTAVVLGEKVIVSFRPPGSHVFIDAEARVVRLVTGTSPGAPAVGLELTEVSPFDRALLAGILERHRARPEKKPRAIVRYAGRRSVVTRPTVQVASPAEPVVLERVRAG